LPTPASQEATTDLSEREKSGRILIIDIAAAGFVFLVGVVAVGVVAVGVDGFSENETTVTLSKLRGVEGVKPGTHYPHVT
jgi:hypothetical protein